MNYEVLIKPESRRNSIVVYAKDIKILSPVLRKLEQAGIDVTVESCAKCMFDIDNCVLDMLNRTMPNLVIIENDETNDGLTLYQLIKDEGTLENLPVYFIGSKDENLKLYALNLGALDYFDKPFNEEEIKFKIENFIKITDTYVADAFHDKLTGLNTRKYGEGISQKAMEMASGQKQPFSLLVIDIDNMSAINSKLGKKKGDEIIKEAVEVFKTHITSKEFIFRYSGERFVVLFPDKESNFVLAAASSMQNEMDLLSSKYGVKISFTGGIAAMSGTNTNFDSLIKLAFQTIEAGKLDGKGRTYIYSSLNRTEIRTNMLIIDDDKVILTILTKRYKNKGYEVFEAQDIKEALDIMRKYTINIVVSNLIVQGITPIELIKALHHEQKESKIIVLLGQRSEQLMDTAIKSGADDYIVKPFSPVELDLRIEKLLG